MCTEQVLCTRQNPSAGDIAENKINQKSCLLKKQRTKRQKLLINFETFEWSKLLIHGAAAIHI